MTKNLAESRNEAMVRLMTEARNKGGNAIIGMRFDTTELGDVWTEICAYGTAVQAVPVTDAARYTASQLGYGGARAAPAAGAAAGAAAAVRRGLRPAENTVGSAG
ncbi:heavy-metal-binding family protein [Mycobacterium kansasii 662]|uniref:Heavy-metal-binding family protein n=2 Tax=Mycobacterium kansasii TaxID=1768 RepID=X7YZ42_MYCKA|nr:heavy-metal-binding family protein [Mycobacterium kansasii 662]